MTLLVLVIAYLVVTIVIGLIAARRVKGTADFAVAGRSLPFFMIITTTFATWFGSEIVLGVPARFVEGGLGSVVEDPFGAGMCLVLVGLFFAAKLYKMNLLTISDYYRERYGRTVEILCSLFIILSYLGWVAAQITALGLVFNLLSGGVISFEMGMVIGVGSVLIYTVFGGMWSVAVTDFIQMIILVVGLLALSIFAGEMAGGANEVIHMATSREMFKFFPEPNFRDIMFFIAAAVTMMLGSMPQQDVFQRVMSANSVAAAKWGTIIGGLLYVLFAFVPMFLVTSALIIMPDEALKHLADDPQKVLPALVMEKMPLVMQVLFFGALLSAIKSCASATMLAPSVTFVENIWHQFVPKKDERTELRTMRITVLVFSLCVLGYAIVFRERSIYEMVSAAYQVTLVGSFVPLAFGVYWKRATTQGAVFSIAFGMLVWLGIMFAGLGEAFPAQLGGLLAAVAGMLLGSLMPQFMVAGGLSAVNHVAPHAE